MANTYVILTDKYGHFLTQPCGDLIPMEQYVYFFCGRPLARFTIAELLRPVRVALVEEAPPHVRNLVPSKFLPQFDSVTAARHELRQLVACGTLDARLDRVELA